VLSYTVRLRSREIGIRMALGADRVSIQGMVLRDGAIVTGIGVAIGLVGALVAGRVMTAMLFGVSPVDPIVIVGAVVFLSLVAAAAAYLPARHASMLAPQEVLQGE
jgi:ABC-type antimicrobial peptide transport system permease subunit